MRNEESSLIVVLIAVLFACVMLSFRKKPSLSKADRVAERLLLSRI
jgi:hypothetical protein